VLLVIIEYDILLVDSDDAPITASTEMASGPLQQVVLENPQHHVFEVGVPSHGFTIEFALPS